MGSSNSTENVRQTPSAAEQQEIERIRRQNEEIRIRVAQQREEAQRLEENRRRIRLAQEREQADRLAENRRRIELAQEREQAQRLEEIRRIQLAQQRERELQNAKLNEERLLAKQKAEEAEIAAMPPVRPGASEVIIVGDCLLRGIWRHFPKEYKVIVYDHAKISTVCLKMKESDVAKHVLQVVLHAGTFDFEQGQQWSVGDDITKIKKNMRDLVRHTHGTFPAATIYISALLPRRDISSTLVNTVNVWYEEYAKQLTADLHDLKVEFLNGNERIQSERRLKDGIHLPYEMLEIFASNIKETLVKLRPLKEPLDVHPIESDIRPGRSTRLVIGDCVLKDVRSHLSDEYRVFWYRNGTIDTIKEKLINMRCAYNVMQVFLHVGTFDLEDFINSFDKTMDKAIELLLISLDRFPNAKIFVSEMLPFYNRHTAVKVNKFYADLTDCLGNKCEIFKAQDLFAMSYNYYNKDGIHFNFRYRISEVFAKAIDAKSIL